MDLAGQDLQASTITGHIIPGVCMVGHGTNSLLHAQMPAPQSTLNQHGSAFRP